MDRIRVRVAQPEGHRVTLWERHPEHPGGEVWLAGAGEYDVAATPAVVARLRDGRLVLVETVAAPPPTPARRGHITAVVIDGSRVAAPPTTPVAGDRPDPEDDPQIDRAVPGKRPARGRKDGDPDDPDGAGRVEPGEEPSEETSVVTRLTGEGAPSSKVQRKPRGGQ